jgi:hypothetical protein
MPPNLVRKVRRDDVPLYDATGGRLKLVMPAPAAPAEVEPSPLLAAILDYLETV